jgi:hypothetical protein
MLSGLIATGNDEGDDDDRARERTPTTTVSVVVAKSFHHYPSQVCKHPSARFAPYRAKPRSQHEPTVGTLPSAPPMAQEGTADNGSSYCSQPPSSCRGKVCEWPCFANRKRVVVVFNIIAESRAQHITSPSLCRGAKW